MYWGGLGGVVGFCEEPFLLGFKNFRNQRSLVSKFKNQNLVPVLFPQYFKKSKEPPAPSFQKIKNTGDSYESTGLG
jgi:hypothetical protein